MARFKVEQQFKDKVTKEIYKVNAEIEMTVKRSKEVLKVLPKALTRVEEVKEDDELQ